MKRFTDTFEILTPEINVTYQDTEYTNSHELVKDIIDNTELSVSLDLLSYAPQNEVKGIANIAKIRQKAAEKVYTKLLTDPKKLS